MTDGCKGCIHDLGGGRDNCRLNLSYECRDGGGFEAREIVCPTCGNVMRGTVCPTCGKGGENKYG